MTEVVVDISSRRIVSAYVAAPFDKGKEALAFLGYEIISLADNAKLRIQEGVKANVSRKGNWVREGVIYVPNKGIFLTKKSPIMAHAGKATDCHRNREDYFLTKEQVEEALSDSVELNANPIPTDRFGDNGITVYAFGDVAKKYGSFLREAGISKMPLWLADIQDKSFVRQMWFGCLDFSSMLGGDWVLCYDDDWVRGLRDLQKISETYIKDLGFSKIKRSLLNKLKQ